MRRYTRTLVVLACSALLLVSCGSDSVELRIDLYTDYTPGTDFERVDTVITPLRSTSRAVQRYSIAPVRVGNAIRTPVRLLDLVLPVGAQHLVQVDLYRRGETASYKSVEATFAGQSDYAMALWVLREAEGERCVEDDDCPDRSACVTGICIGGRCALETDSELCDGETVCDYEMGCIEPPMICEPDAECSRPGLVSVETEACGGCADVVIREREIRCGDDCTLQPGAWGECLSVDRIPAVSVSVGDESSCALDASGRLSCWGRGSLGRLGTGSRDNEWVPRRVTGDITFRQVDAGLEHTCGVDASGRGYCWGHGSLGRLGNGDTDIELSPQSISPDLTWSAVSAGNFHSCGVSSTGGLFCWGQGSLGRLGTGSTRDSRQPVQVGSDTDWAEVSAGMEHTCALKSDGRGYCWGFNSVGQLGLGDSGGVYESPQAISGERRWQTIQAGADYSCGVDVDGALWCWGSCVYRRLGVGCDSGTRSSPQRVGMESNWTRVTTGFAHGCAINDRMELHCWGWGAHGRLGNGSDDHQERPVRVGTDRDWQDVGAGRYQTCALALNGLIYCFGRNLSGALGVPSRPSESLTPALACF